LFYQKLEHTHF